MTEAQVTKMLGTPQTTIVSASAKTFNYNCSSDVQSVAVNFRGGVVESVVEFGDTSNPASIPMPAP
jgi:hypothetical protein